MNKWIGKGRLTRDPEVRYTQSGKRVASFTLACDRARRKNAEGNNQQTADFISCIAWEKLAEVVDNYCTKGREILVEAHMQTRSYDAKDGTKRYVTEAVLTNLEFCGKKSDYQTGGSGTSNGSQQQGQGYPARVPEHGFGQTIPDEEIPF